MFEALKIRYKNFLGVGDQFIEIDLSKSPTTLIYGKNGSSKSTITDALFFAWFGKAFRDINKPTLVNTINKKDCLVEHEFRVNGIHHMIRRGIKPNIFEIYKEGVLIDQQSKTLDYQDYLETYIMKFIEKTARQVAVLGSASFKPFMQLSASDRRAVIEDLLGISIFTEMNKINAAILKNIKLTQDELNTNLKVQKEVKEKLQESLNLRLQRIGESKEAKQSRLTSLKAEVTTLETTLDQIKEQAEEDLAELQKIDITKITTNYNNASNLFVQQDTKYKEKLDRSFFFRDNKECPTCEQQIPESYSAKVQQKIENDLENIFGSLKRLEDIKKNLEVDQATWTALNNKTLAAFRKYEELKLKLDHQKLSIADYEADMNVQYSNENIEIDNQKILDIDLLIEQLETDRAIVSEQLDYYTEIADMLKDDGVKSTIIKHYLPKINKAINEYLVKFSLPIQFYLDESFDEHIKTRGKENLTYYNFSEGEKKRIDLAILFAWREIAKLKNTCNINLLFMDEVCDSSLDQEAIEVLMNVIEEVSMKDNVNIFVISHRAADQLYDKFRSAIHFKKINGFPRIM